MFRLQNMSEEEPMGDLSLDSCSTSLLARLWSRIVRLQRASKTDAIHLSSTLHLVERRTKYNSRMYRTLTSSPRACTSNTRPYTPSGRFRVKVRRCRAADDCVLLVFDRDHDKVETHQDRKLQGPTTLSLTSPDTDRIPESDASRLVAHDW